MKAYKHKIQYRLLEHAEAVFAEQGYEGATVRDIAARADTNAALIYYHFASKENLYRSIFEYRLEQLTETLSQTVFQAGQRAVEKLRVLIMVYVHNIRQHFYFHRMLNSEIISFRNHFFKRVILGSIRGNTLFFRELLQEGIDNGEFHSVDQDLFLMTLFHLLHQVVGKSPLACELLELEEFPEEQVVERILQFAFQQLQPAKNKAHSLPE